MIARREELRAMSKADLIATVLAAEFGKTKTPRRENGFDFSEYETLDVALRIAYLGDGYSGLQFQPNLKTIESEILDALHQTRLVPPSVKCVSELDYTRCGRTDKGVSAFGNVLCLKLRGNKLGSTAEPLDYPRILNPVLSGDVKIIGACLNPSKINARFNAKSRCYKYSFYRDNMDIELMKEAAKLFIGTHDFRNFAKIDRFNATSTFTRQMLSIEIEPLEQFLHSSDDMFVVTIHGWAFVYHQIRNMLAILFLIGRGDEKMDVIPELLDITKYPSRPAYEMVDALPLVLYDCEFEDLDFELSDAAALGLGVDLLAKWRQKKMELSLLDLLKNKVDAVTTVETREVVFDNVIQMTRRARDKRKYRPLHKLHLSRSKAHREKTPQHC